MTDSLNVNVGGGYSLKVLAIVAVVGLIVGAWGMYSFGPRLTLTNSIEKPVIKEVVQTVTQTKLQYVPGETVYLPSAGGGTTPAKLDGKFDIGKPTFTYTLNSKPGQFTKADDERYVFDKNMVALTQSSNVAIKIDVPTVDVTRRNAIGPYVTTESYGLMVSRETNSQRILVMAGKKWDTGFEAGAAWQVKF